MSELKDNILKLRKKGLNYNEIKLKLNCSKGTISYHCNKNDMGVDFLIENDFLISLDEEQYIIELRNEGKSYGEIRKMSNLSIDKIRFVCRKHKIYDNNILRKPTFEIINDMQTYYNDCKSCNKVADKFGWSVFTILKYINLNKKNKISEEERKSNLSKRVIMWRKDKKLKLVEYKGGCCQNCGYKKSIGALEFHHINPDDKDFTISGKSYSFERLKKEVDKCVLVCSNCHIEIHEELKNNGYSDIMNNLK